MLHPIQTPVNRRKCISADSYKPQKNIPAPDSCKPQKNVQAQSSYEPQQNMQAQGSQIAEMPNYTARQVPAEKPQQLNFFEEKLLEPQAKAEHKIIGQVFDTYWLVEFHDNLYIIDQHAAHERVLYEQTLKGMKTREFTSQLISPANRTESVYAGGRTSQALYGSVHADWF